MKNVSTLLSNAKLSLSKVEPVITMLGKLAVSAWILTQVFLISRSVVDPTGWGLGGA